MREGEFWKDERGVWLARPPGCHLGTLANHSVTEHEDGTITVSPSILIHPHDRHDGPCPGWHGYLERGVWRQC